MMTGSGGLADFDIDFLSIRFPSWRITRMATMIRADRDGEKTRFAQSASVLAAALADAEFADHVSRASRVRSHDCPITGQ
jgi:hypothetical protein